jgi:hypothetical protein
MTLLLVDFYYFYFLFIYLCHRALSMLWYGP